MKRPTWLPVRFNKHRMNALTVAAVGIAYILLVLFMARCIDHSPFNK